jgi:hypothetical protein
MDNSKAGKPGKRESDQGVWLGSAVVLQGSSKAKQSLPVSHAFRPGPAGSAKRPPSAEKRTGVTQLVPPHRRSLVDSLRYGQVESKALLPFTGRPSETNGRPLPRLQG